jgi:small conductance mechanosensitive channel
MVQIRLGYEEDVDRAMDIFLGAIQAVSGVEIEPAPMIQAMSMDDSNLSLTAFYWVNQKENSPLRVHSEVLKAINRASHEHLINLPYPIQTVLVQQSSANDAG